MEPVTVRAVDGDSLNDTIVYTLQPGKARVVYACVNEPFLWETGGQLRCCYT